MRDMFQEQRSRDRWSYLITFRLDPNKYLPVQLDSVFRRAVKTFFNPAPASSQFYSLRPLRLNHLRLSAKSAVET